ncbi:MAG: CPBP family intramembrane metalloprotease [Planctomycetes bacterium]|nr:CPBP family intramembrane metalloprotease [Planctomycetota bacterium]
MPVDVASAREPGADGGVARDWRYSFAFAAALTALSALLTQSVIRWVFVGKGVVDPRVPAWLAAELPALLGSALLALAVVRWIYRAGPAAHGCRLLAAGRTRAAVGYVLLCGALVTAGWTVIALIVAAANTPQENLTLLEQNAVWRAWNRPNALVRSFVIHSLFLVGFLEEPLARGLIQTALERRYSRVINLWIIKFRVSTLLAAVLFAAWHIDLVPFNPGVLLKETLVAVLLLLPISFLLSYVYEKTQSLLAPILLHNVVDGGKLLAFYWVLATAAGG